MQLLSNEQVAFLYGFKAALRSKNKEKFIILLGYTHGVENHTEWHWELIEDTTELSTREEKAIAKNRLDKIRRQVNISWGRTVNSSYERFFGRGKLSDTLCKKKVLIIGAGAIGSSLANILVRGGLRVLSLADSDIVEPGNICRSSLRYTWSGKSKVDDLTNSLIQASPFINILPLNLNIGPCLPTEGRYSDMRKVIDTFDLIFDCSTDKYLHHTFDLMDLGHKVVNLSVNDGATAFVCVAGVRHIAYQKSIIYSRWSDNAEPFYVGTGCYHSTFRASFAEINAKLNLAVSKIDRQIEEDVGLASFIIQENEEGLQIERP